MLGCYDSNITNCPDGSAIITRYDQTYTRLVQLVSWLCGYYNIVPSSSTIVRHSHWKETDCPGNILGENDMFDAIIEDVQNTMEEGTGLCYDFVDADANGTGGVCMNLRYCTGNDLVVDTGTEDQCNRYGQICCKLESNGDGVNDQDRNMVFLVIGVSGVVVVLLLGIAFLYKKRKDHTLRHSVYNDLREKVVDDHGFDQECN